MTRIALIHIVPASQIAAQEAFRRQWPEVDLVNIVDDALGRDRDAAGGLTDPIEERVGALGRYALRTGACGVLFTCSAFGRAIDAFAATTTAPVLKPNEAMFRDALQVGGRVGMVATFSPAVAPMTEEFEILAGAVGHDRHLTTVIAEGALDALNAGDIEAHDHLVANAVATLNDCDVVLLAQFSMARARATAETRTPGRVLTSPDSAVRELRRRLQGPDR